MSLDDILFDNSIETRLFNNAAKREPPRCKSCGVVCYWVEDRYGWTLYSGSKKHDCLNTVITVLEHSDNSIMDLLKGFK